MKKNMETFKWNDLLIKLMRCINQALLLSRKPVTVRCHASSLNTVVTSSTNKAGNCENHWL